MNRQTKRMLQRQGQVGPDGQPVADARRQQQQAASKRARRERTSPATFLREVRGELRRVAWPTRPEVVNYSTVVLFTLVVLIALIFVIDFVSARSILFLFDAP